MAILQFSDLTRSRLRKFREVRRAWWSFWILSAAFVISLGSELIANDRPLLLGFEGRLYAPVFRFYPESRFGGRHGTAPDYHALASREEFLDAGGWMVFPPIPHSPTRIDLDQPGHPPFAPGSNHLLGTDSSARDIASRLLYGFRISMLFALTLAVIAAVIGVIVGGVQGYLGGATDLVLQRLIEIWSSLPFLYVVILIGSIYGQSFMVLIGVMSLFNWIGLSYYMRGEFYRLKSAGYVRTARALGLGHRRIFFNEILPNALTPVITILPFTLIGGIGALTALDFLGFGMPPPTASWGEMMRDGLRNLHAPWITLSATIALFVTLLLATFIGEGAREAFDPRSRERIE